MSDKTKFQQQFERLYTAGFSGIFVKSFDYPGVVTELSQIAKDCNFMMLQFDVLNGTTPCGDSMVAAGMRAALSSQSDAMLKSPFPRALPRVAEWADMVRASMYDPETKAMRPDFEGYSPSSVQDPDSDRQIQGVLVLVPNLVCTGRDNIHLLPYLQAAQSFITDGASQRLVLVMVDIANQLPPAMTRYFTSVEHSLPNDAVYERLIDDFAKDADPELKQLSVEACRGLTFMQAENAIALSLVSGDEHVLRPSIIWDEKTKAIDSMGGMLQLYRGDMSLERLKGCQGAADALLPFLLNRQSNPELRTRGALLSGPPGTGKTDFVNAIGNASNRRVLWWNMGLTRSKYAGETDENVYRVLEMAEAMAPCILAIDEMEKAFSGAASSGESDGGSGARVFATILTWASKHTSDVVLIGTVNHMERLLASGGEMIRSGRFDWQFFFDVPNDDVIEQILLHYVSKFTTMCPGWKGMAGMPIRDMVKLMQGWTGGEIEACVRKAAASGKPIASCIDGIVPIKDTQAAELKKMRQSAENRCLSVETGKKYQILPTKAAADKPSKRKVGA